jgi:MarR family transcriptional regulator, lower aerobic nicotinate degradation pathway regulator
VRIDQRLPPPLIDSPAFVVMQAGRLAFDWTVEVLEVFGLTVADFAALALIHQLGPIKQGAVAERIGISRVAMSGVASVLAERNLIGRVAAFTDLRRRLLHMTDIGIDLLTIAMDELAEVDSRFPEATKDLATLAPEEAGWVRPV